MTDTVIGLGPKWKPFKELDIPVVEWRSIHKDSRGVALIGTEDIPGDKIYRELYADGSIYRKDYDSNTMKKEEKIDMDILKKAVEEYQKKYKVIEISELLKIQKQKKDKNE